MPDMEKVIKGMEMCISPDECSPNDCPYYDRPRNESGLCWDRLMTDAIALLKEQEAVEPYVTGRGESFETAETWWYACGNCHEALDVNDKYCRHCGRSVKWE